MGIAAKLASQIAKRGVQRAGARARRSARNRAIDNIKQAIKESVSSFGSKKEMDKLALKAVQLIVKRTRLGFGVESEGGSLVRLAPLEESTKKQRGRLNKNGELSPLTRPGRSNLTATGQMLDSLKGKSDRKGRFIINFGKNVRKGGRGNKSKATNSQIAFFVSGKRPWANFSKTELKQLEDIASDKIVRELTRMFAKL